MAAVLWILPGLMLGMALFWLTGIQDSVLLAVLGLAIWLPLLSAILALAEEDTRRGRAARRLVGMLMPR